MDLNIETTFYGNKTKQELLNTHTHTLVKEKKLETTSIVRQH